MTDIGKLLRDVRKVTDSESFATSKLGQITDWIDTGDFGLNRIISGSVYRGIPAGRVITIHGESATGKSFLCAQIAANALTKNNYSLIFYFDSEGGALTEFFKSKGCDLEKIEHVPIDSVEDATVKILSVFTKIKEFKSENPDAKFLCILDSLGALVTNKVFVDATNKGKQVSDMGSKAKLINTLVKASLMPALRTNTPFIITNHVYDDPSAMYPSKIKNQGGGKGLQFASHISIQCTRKLEKEKDKEEKEKKDKEKKEKKLKKSKLIESATDLKPEEQEATPEQKAETLAKAGSEASYYQSTVLNFFTTKNRIIRPFIETDVYLSFTRGTLKYFGLVEIAKKYGFIKEGDKQGFFVVPSYGDKRMRMSEIILKEEIWETFLKDFNDKSEADLKYSSGEKPLELEVDAEDVEEASEETSTEQQ